MMRMSENIVSPYFNWANEYARRFWNLPVITFAAVIESTTAYCKDLKKYIQIIYRQTKKLRESFTRERVFVGLWNLPTLKMAKTQQVHTSRLKETCFDVSGWKRPAHKGWCLNRWSPLNQLLWQQGKGHFQLSGVLAADDVWCEKEEHTILYFVWTDRVITFNNWN